MVVGPATAGTAVVSSASAPAMKNMYRQNGAKGPGTAEKQGLDLVFKTSSLASRIPFPTHVKSGSAKSVPTRAGGFANERAMSFDSAKLPLKVLTAMTSRLEMFFV